MSFVPKKMNATVTYQWMEELAKSALDAYYKTISGRPWLFVLLGALFFIEGLIQCCLYDGCAYSSIFFILGLILLLRPIRLHFHKRKISRDAGKLITKPTVTLNITDTGLTISTFESTRTIQWDTVTRIKKVDSFLLIFARSILLASLPCEAFDADQINYIISKTKSVQQGRST